MGRQLSGLAAESKFTWEISPSNSPWRQGRSEVRIKILKRLLTMSVGSTRLTPVELQTALYECANPIDMACYKVEMAKKLIFKELLLEE